MQIACGLLIAAIGLFVTMRVARGNARILKLVLAGVAGLVFFLLADRNFWVGCLLLSALSISIPGLPFSPQELGLLCLVFGYFVRAVVFREPGSAFSRRSILLAVPFFCWVFFIFFLNPVGLHIFGSTMIGGRNYFKLLLGFVALFVLSRMEFSEKGLLWLFWAMVASCGLTVVGSFSNLLRLTDAETVTRYFLLPFGTLFLLLISRYDLKRIVSSFRLFVFVLACLILAVWSGKRTLVGEMALAPFLLAFLRRRELRTTFFCGVVAFFLVFLFVEGHGTYYRLPFSVQRALSFLPGHWDPFLENYGFRDLFRDQVRRRAQEVARAHPWVGRRGFAMDVNEIVWYLSAGASHETGAGHAISGNWHNKFWGMWADFGVFAPFSWYFFSIGAFVWALRKRRLFSGERVSDAFYRYWTLMLFFDLVLSYGHSAETPFQQWQTFGCLLALFNMRQKEIGKSVRRVAPVDSTAIRVSVPEIRP